MARKRLQKAAQSAQSLLDVAKNSLDAYQQVEVEAYSSLMQGIYLLESKDFQNALDYLLKSKIIYQKISQFKDTLEEVIYKEKVSQIDTLIRQCAFSLKTAGIATDGDKVINNLVSSYPQKKSLEEQVARTKTQAKREQIESMEEISYNNKIIPLKTEKLKQVFKRVQSQMHEITEYQAAEIFDAGHQISNFLALTLI